MKGYKEFSCNCGKEFTDFDLWFNHIIISKHMPLTEEDIQKIKEFAQKLAQ